MSTVRGGRKFEEAMAELAKKVGARGRNTVLRVGFLENATYPDGKPVAMIAAIQEYGAPRAGIPPRPFFRSMIEAKQGEWPAAIRQLLIDNDYDVQKTLDMAGAAIAGQLRQSITEFEGTPLKPATIKRKGFAKQLVDTGHMLASVDHEVKSG